MTPTPPASTFASSLQTIVRRLHSRGATTQAISTLVGASLHDAANSVDVYVDIWDCVQPVPCARHTERPDSAARTMSTAVPTVPPLAGSIVIVDDGDGSDLPALVARWCSSSRYGELAARTHDEDDATRSLLKAARVLGRQVEILTRQRDALVQLRLHLDEHELTEQPCLRQVGLAVSAEPPTFTRGTIVRISGLHDREQWLHRRDQLRTADAASALAHDTGARVSTAFGRAPAPCFRAG